MSLPCPLCGHALVAEAGEQIDRCSSCDGDLRIAYRYNLVAARGAIAGGTLYEAVDSGFGERVGVLFVEDPSDAIAVERFVTGNQLFAEIAGRGLVKIRDVARASEPRPYVVMDWIEGGTLESVVRRGALDRAALLRAATDLLTGLAKAHRAIPPIAHGHIHPGKIGFLASGEAVLFGFEWAGRVAPPSSNLADAFIEDAGEEDDPISCTSDLRQLATSLIYAATGSWMGESSIQQQISQAAELPEPLGLLLIRMLAAGTDEGYAGATEANGDLHRLLAGDGGWQARRSAAGRPRDNLVSPTGFSSFEGYSNEEEADEEILDSGEFVAVDSAPPRAAARVSPSLPPRSGAAAMVEQQARARAQAQVQAQAKQASKVLLGVVVGVMVLGTCVAGLIGGSDDSDPTPQVVSAKAPAPARAPAPAPQPVPELDEIPPLPEELLRPPSPVGRVSQNHRFTGVVIGPEDHAGLEIGDTCEVWVEPNDSDLNCRWYVDCGEPRRRYYGGGNVGYAVCEVVDGHPVFAQDEDDDAPDGAFLADLRAEPRMMMVKDRWMQTPLKALISIDAGGGPTVDSIPQVPLAARPSQSEVEAMIAAGADPLQDEADALEAPELDDALAAEPNAELPEQLPRAVIRSALSELQVAECPIAEGLKVEVEIEIRRNGAVSKASISPRLDERAQACIVGAVRSASFAPFSGEPMRITWVFEGSGY